MSKLSNNFITLNSQLNLQRNKSTLFSTISKGRDGDYPVTTFRSSNSNRIPNGKSYRSMNENQKDEKRKCIPNLKNYIQKNDFYYK